MIEMYFLFFTFILSIYGMETWAYVVATTLEKKNVISVFYGSLFSVFCLYVSHFLYFMTSFISNFLCLFLFILFLHLSAVSLSLFYFNLSLFVFFLSIVSHILPFLSIFIHMLSSATLLLFVQYCSCVCVRVVRVWINPFKIN